MAATGGHDGAGGSGRRPLAHIARTLPGVSWPSSVVRSTIRTARSSANALAVVLIDRVASPAARASTPTWSTAESPWRNRRRVSFDAVTSGRGDAAMVTRSGYCQVRSAPSWACGLQGLGPQGRKAGLDGALDDAQALVEGPERRLHGVDREPLDLVPAVVERFDQLVHLVAQHDVGHEPVVGVDRHPEA